MWAALRPEKRSCRILPRIGVLASWNISSTAGPIDRSGGKDSVILNMTPTKEYCGWSLIHDILNRETWTKSQGWLPLADTARRRIVLSI